MQDRYDAVVVLCGGMRKIHGEYYASGYEESDGFGMLGGAMRLHATLCLLKSVAAGSVVFSSGTSEKDKAMFGPDVPPEADVYAKRFMEMAAESGLQIPEVILENTSVTTETNIREVIRIAAERGWKTIAMVSSDYHVARMQALCDMILQRDPGNGLRIRLLSAEQIVKECEPGKWDTEIDAAYASPGAHQRIENESKGLQALLDGTYVFGEFQLAKERVAERDI